MHATHLSLVPFPATGIRPCFSSSSSRRSSDLRSLKTAASSSNSSWWTPLFGWSSEPDYIDSANKDETRSDHDAAGTKPAKTAKFAPGCFTAEKAKQLRMLTKETESFHDVMYHSAIASRLATDTRNRSDS